MIKIDLHTHSIDSPDGGLSEDDYWRVLSLGILDVIAVTDHGSVDFAKFLKHKSKFENSIIVGQEIKSKKGEVIGLFLDKSIPSNLSLEKTIAHIKDQNGLVVIPHPEDAHRSSLKLRDIQNISKDISAIEIHNGRQIKNSRNKTKIEDFANSKQIPLIASSDAHSFSGVGNTFTVLPSYPVNEKDLELLLTQKIELCHKRPPIYSLLAPKFNRMRNKMLS